MTLNPRPPLTLALCAVGSLAHATPPTRTPLAVIPIQPEKLVSRIEVNRVDFAPGQIMPMHMHPVPVVCFIDKGDFVVKIGEAPERKVALGEVTLEGAGVIIHYFKNTSNTQPAQLLCATLAGAQDKVLSIMLDDPAAVAR